MASHEEATHGGGHSQEDPWADAPPLRPGWNRPKPAHIPHPSYWPITLAMGITFIGWGLVGNIILIPLGIIVFIIGIAGWIREMINENR